MYSTILTGRVSRENWNRLEESYIRALKHPPAGLLQSFLMNSVEDPFLWYLVTVWQSKKDYEESKRLKLTETCVQLFCDAGSVPERSRYQVVKFFQNTAKMIAA